MVRPERLFADRELVEQQCGQFWAAEDAELGEDRFQVVAEGMPGDEQPLAMSAVRRPRRSSWVI